MFDSLEVIPNRKCWVEKKKKEKKREEQFSNRCIAIVLLRLLRLQRGVGLKTEIIQENYTGEWEKHRSTERLRKTAQN